MNEKLAEIIGCEVDDVDETLLATVFAEATVRGFKPSKIEMLRFKRFILRTGLSPLDGGIYAHCGSTGYEPGLRIDGWLELAKKAGAREIVQTYSPETIRFEEFAKDVQAHVWIETTIKLANESTFTHREFMVENFFMTDAWMSMPNRCNGHKSVAQTIRLFTGIYARDENSKEFTSQQQNTAPASKPLLVEVDEVKPNAEPPKHEVKVEQPVNNQSQVETQDEVKNTEPVNDSVSETAVEQEATGIPASKQQPQEANQVPVQENDEDKGSAMPESSAEPDPLVFTTTKEMLEFHWGGHKPSAKLKGDAGVMLSRIESDPNLWSSIVQYIKSTPNLKEAERAWTLAVLDAVKKMKEASDGKSA